MPYTLIIQPRFPPLLTLNDGAQWYTGTAKKSNISDMEWRVGEPYEPCRHLCGLKVWRPILV